MSTDVDKVFANLKDAHSHLTEGVRSWTPETLAAMDKAVVDFEALRAVRVVRRAQALSQVAMIFPAVSLGMLLGQGLFKTAQTVREAVTLGDAFLSGSAWQPLWMPLFGLTALCVGKLWMSRKDQETTFHKSDELQQALRPLEFDQRDRIAAANTSAGAVLQVANRTEISLRQAHFFAVLRAQDGASASSGRNARTLVRACIVAIALEMAVVGGYFMAKMDAASAVTAVAS